MVKGRAKALPFFWDMVVNNANGPQRWPEGVKDNTHFSEYGAARVAALAVQEWLRLGLPAAEWVR